MENERVAAVHQQQKIIALEKLKESAIKQTKSWVSEQCENPIEHNGKYYSVTLEKQQLLSMKLEKYITNHFANKSYILEWNDTGESSVEWEFEDLLELSNKIDAHVRLIVSKQQAAEKAIRQAAAINEVEEILEDFI